VTPRAACGRSILVSTVLVLFLGSVARAQDPGLPGPFGVTKTSYDDGDTAFTPAGFPGPVEVRASVHYPTSLAGGPFPLVVFLHGRHAVCASGVFTWPCPFGPPIPSFEGYDYVGSVLASHGYIVVSISANGINARDNSVTDLGGQARAELIQRHLNKWSTFNTTGGAPFGSLFVGRVDLTRVGTMGHSRGGEGVMRHFLHNQSLGSPYGIKAVFPLAPVDFNRPVVNNVPFEVLLPYCDGDVADLQGVHYYDDARYSAAGDLAPKHYVLVMGANHNYYNTIWTPGSGFPGAVDDWGGVVGDPHCDEGQPRRLTAAQQRGTGLAFLTAFFRRYLGGETNFDPLLKGDVPAPPSATTNDLFSSYHPPDSATARRDVNRLLTSASLTVNQLGGSAAQSGITPYDLCGGESPQPLHCLSALSFHQPHTTPSARSAARGLSQLRGGWNATSATYTNMLPAGTRDVSGFQVLQFRASVNYEDFRNAAGVPQDFTVRLTDGAATVRDVLVSNFSDALFYPPGSVAEVPKVVLNTVRIPLSGFAGLNLSDVRSVQFRFNQTGSGALLITDLAFADAGAPAGLGDLQVTAVSNPPATVTPGGAFGATDTTANLGTAGTVSSTTRFWLSLDTVKSGGDVLLSGARAVGPLGAGANSTGPTTVTVPGGTALNTYFLLACADDTGSVAESNEGNNCRASATTVSVQAAVGQPDLVPSSLTSPNLAAVGQTISIKDKTANVGPAGAGATTTAFYLSADKNLGGDLLLGSRGVPALAAGAASTTTTAVALPPGTVGKFYVLAVVDHAAGVAEADETNNIRARAITIGPDLQIQSLSGPATAARGATVQLNFVAVNSGGGAANASTTRVYLSTNKSLDASDVLLTSRAVPPLAPSATDPAANVPVTIPAGTTTGTKYFLAIADATSVVAESKETNNRRTVAVTIVP
jgi:hypothetical protein